MRRRPAQGRYWQGRTSEQAAPGWLCQRTISIRISAGKDVDNCKRHDAQVKPDGPILDIVKVKLDSGRQVGIAAQIVDLCPSGDSGLHQVSLHVAGNLGAEDLHQLRPLRTWANDGHLASQHIDELREFVQARSAQKGAEWGSTYFSR